MRKRMTSLLLTLVMLLSLVPAMGVTASAGEMLPFHEVGTYQELIDAVHSGKPRIKLKNDINTRDVYASGIGIPEDKMITIGYDAAITLDLNGCTLALETLVRGGFSFFTVYGELEIKDSSPSQNGKITGKFPSVLASMFRTQGGTLTLQSGTLMTSSNKNDVITVGSSGGHVVINGGRICSGKWDTSSASPCGYAVLAVTDFADVEKMEVIINGGVFDGAVGFFPRSEFTCKEPRFHIYGGTFKQDVLLRCGQKTFKTHSPILEICGGSFEGGLKIYDWGMDPIDRYGDAAQSYPPFKLLGGTFSCTVDLCYEKSYWGFDSPKLDQFIGALKYERMRPVFAAMLENSAIVKPSDTYTAVNIDKGMDWALREGYGTYYQMLLKGTAANPIRIIPNAWGMKSVTLDGKEINYAKDWYGTVERMDNSTAHTLTFEWYPLAQELKDAGYTYRANFDCYTVGSNTPTTSVPISATATEYSHTIPAGKAPSVYPFDLQLNLDKNGSSVGIFTNDHIVKLVVSEAADTFISTVSFNVDKADVGEPGELSFEAKDKNGNTVAIHPNVTWDPTNIKEGENHVSFTIPAPKGYTFSGENGKVTTLKFGGVDVIGYVDSNGALNYSFPLDVVHRHKADHVSYNAKYHWEACSCGQKIMNTSEPHTMGDWVEGATLSSGGVVYTRSCTSGCGYTETTIDYKNVKHVTSLVLNMENYPMDGMRPHNFVHQDGDESVADTEIPGQSFYKLTHRDSTIKYPSFSIATGDEKVKLSATNPEAYDDPAENPDFAKWTTATGTLWLRPETGYSDYETEFQTNGKYKAHLTLDAKEGYAFYEDFKTNQDNFKLYTDMEGITIENYGVRRWYYFSNKPSYDDPNVPEGWGWYTQAPADNSAGASRVQITFVITARNEGDLSITLPELKAGDDLKAKWAVFDGTPNSDFVKDCYRSETMAWWYGPSRVIHSGIVTGESVTAQAGQTYRLEIPAVNANVLARITITNPTAATRIDESPDGAITVTYKLPAAADDKTVNGAAVSITPPAYGDTPSTVATVAGTALCTASAVTWNPADTAFEAKEYTATVTLTANDGYTFASDAVFTINGHMATPEPGGTATSVTLSYTFPALTGPHTHTYGGSWFFATPDTHIRYCTANDGSYEEAPHSITSWTDKGDGKTHTGTCADCGYEKTENHSWVIVSEVPPTATAEGSRSYKCSATGCTATKTESIPKLTEYTVSVKDDGNGTASADRAKAVAGTEITLTAKANKGYHFKEWKVVKGGVAITDNKFTMPDEAVEIMAIFEKNASTGTGTGTGATTYLITVKSAKNGDVTASHKSASKGTAVTLTVDPDKGYVLDALTVLDGKDKEIKLTEKNGKYTFTMPASKVTVEAAFKASAPTGKNPFTDVPAGSYYEDAVIWAVDKGITTGTSATTFNPNGICTRAQAVTFLWRAAGSPAAKSAVMPFTDVKAGSYYYDAVLWAVENGITKGTSDTTFSPDATCSRAQIVTFLWRANGSPAVSGNSAFTDVASDAYYAAAVTWAEKNDITGGIGGGLFGSNNNCTRAQIVTFIYRSVK